MAKAPTVVPVEDETLKGNDPVQEEVKGVTEVSMPEGVVREEMTHTLKGEHTNQVVDGVTQITMS